MKLEANPEFCRWWPHHDASSTLDGHKRIEHPIWGLLEFEHTTLQIPSDPDVRVMIYTPSTETRAKMQRWLDGANQPAAEQKLFI